MSAHRIAIVLSFLVASDAFAHAKFRANAQGLFVPRNNIANKIGPCGPGSTRTNTPSFVIAGSTIQVVFDEFIEHPGYFRIAFSANGDVFAPDNTAQGTAGVLDYPIADLPGANMNNPRIYTRTITVPNTPCDKCTLQLIQYMTETNPPELYFSCADIVILPAGSVLPTPNPSPTPLTGGSGSSGSSGSSTSGAGTGSTCE